jgi:dipeptidyl aminopeptidase/acylaminoacyl peptidase
MAKHSKRRPMTAEDLWGMARIGAVALSPDARHVVATVTTYSTEHNRGSTQLWRLDADGRGQRLLTTVGERCSGAAFSPDGTQVAFLAQRVDAGGDGKKDDSAQLYLLPAGGGEARRMAARFEPGIESFHWLGDSRRIVFAAWSWPGAKGAAAQARRWKQEKDRKDTGYVTDEAYYRYWDRNLPEGRRLTLWLLDTATGRTRPLFEGTPYELPRDSGGEAYAASPDGRHVAFAFDPAAEQKLGNRCAIGEIDLKTSRITRRADDAAWDFGAPVYAPDGRTLAVGAAHTGVHHTALAEPALVPARGPWRLLAPGWDHHVNGDFRFSADGRAVYVSAEDRGRCHLWRLAVGEAAGDAAVPRAVHRGGWVQAFDLAADGTLAVLADSANHPPRVLLQAPGGAAARRIERFNDERLAQLALGRVEEHVIPGAGGQPVQLWLTHPHDIDARPKRPRATTHVIHGGPFAAAGDTFSWRWNPHVFAARGDVVVQVNFHGSSGFGHAFRHSLVGQQGELEFADIEAATDWVLKTRPWADKRRVFATGGSYGGFMVAWINGHAAPGRYRATVCHAGVYDRVATFSADSYPQRPKDLAANWWQDMPKVLAQSPHAFAKRMRTPTLVIHGARDYRVPDHNGLAYYNTLKALGVKARLLWFADENHWILKPCNSLQWYREFRRWLDENDLR